MFKKLLVVIMVLATAFTANAQNFKEGKWIDLTHSFNKNSVYWPTSNIFKQTKVFEGDTDGGYYYSSYDYAASEHGGTHLDAPIHFSKGGLKADELAISQLVGPGIVIDVKDQAKNNIDYLVSAEDIRSFEDKYGKIPQGAIVLLNTGRASLYLNRKAYMGTNERGQEAVSKLHFPGLSLEGAKLLVSRKISAVGLDTPSIDYGQSTKFLAHIELMGNNISAFENVADMNALPPVGSFIIALPMKIEGGSGGPLRIIAYLK